MPVQLIRKVRTSQPTRISKIVSEKNNSLIAVIGALPNITTDATTKNQVIRIGSAAPKATSRGIAVSLGTGNGLYLQSSQNLDLPVSHSISALVFIDSIPTFHHFLSKGTSSVNWDSYTFGIGSNGPVTQQRFSYTFRKSNSESDFCEVYQPGYITTTGWFHVVATHDGSTLSLYVNGKLEATAAGSASGPYVNTSRLFVGGVFNDSLAQINRSVPYPLQDIRLYKKCLTKTEVEEDYKNPWQIFEPETIPLFYSTGGGGATDLSIFDALHSHAGDNLAFSLDTYLAAQDSSHAHSADNLTLDASTAISLVLSDALHGLSSDVIDFITGSYLQVADALHGHTADALTLATASFLAVAEALHSHTADNITLDTSNSTPLTTQDATHAHSADNTVLTLDTWLSIVEAVHAHSADNVSISSEELLAVADALHSLASDALVLTLPSPPGTCPSLEEIVAAIWADPRALTVAKFLGLK